MNTDCGPTLQLLRQPSASEPQNWHASQVLRRGFAAAPGPHGESVSLPVLEKKLSLVMSMPQRTGSHALLIFPAQQSHP